MSAINMKLQALQESPKAINDQAYKFLIKARLVWLYKKLRFFRSSPSISCIVLLVTLATIPTITKCAEIDEMRKENQGNNLNERIQARALPANHRMESLDPSEKMKLSPIRTRSSRQYDPPSMTTSSTGNFASISGDAAAYVAQVPIGSGANYVSPSGPGSYVGSSADISGAYHDSLARAYGSYPMQHAGPSPFSQAHHMGPITSLFSGANGGLLGNSMFPLMSKGFDLGEVVCTAIAVAIGAVIVGAPFILIYLFVMNQVNGGASPGLNPSGGPISLTGPSSSTNVSGRKKRHTSIHEVLFKQLSPFVDSERVAKTFKILMDSMAKYQM